MKIIVILFYIGTFYKCSSIVLNAGTISVPPPPCSLIFYERNPFSAIFYLVSKVIVIKFSLGIL